MPKVESQCYSTSRFSVQYFFYGLLFYKSKYITPIHYIIIVPFEIDTIKTRVLHLCNVR